MYKDPKYMLSTIEDSNPNLDWVPKDNLHKYQQYEKNVLVFNYTLSCPLTCDFCCYGCGPKRTEKMPLDLALDLIDQAAELGVFSSVAFTGGEAMMYYDELLIIGDKLHEKNLPFTLVTAGHWAKSKNDAEMMVGELAKRGLYRFNISHDPSHEKFVPLSSVINAVVASSKRGINTYVVGTFYSPTESLATKAPQLVNLPHVELLNKYVSKVGRAINKDLTQKTFGLKMSLDDYACYRRIYHDIVIFYDGQAFPCCSTFNRATPGISVGNAFNDSLKEIYQRTEGSLMLRIMKREGFSRIYEIIKEIDPVLFEQLPSAKQVAGPCSLCNAIFGNNELSKKVKLVFDVYEKETVSNAIEVMSELLGESKTTQILDEVISNSSS